MDGMLAGLTREFAGSASRRAALRADVAVAADGVDHGRVLRAPSRPWPAVCSHSQGQETRLLDPGCEHDSARFPSAWPLMGQVIVREKAPKRYRPVFSLGWEIFTET